MLRASMVLIGTFIGAGFASGREIWQYFGIFGKFSFFGVVLSCWLLGLFTYCTADNILYLGEKNYIEKVCRYEWVNWLFNSYMLLMLCTMITAFGECLNQVFGLPKMLGVALIDVITVAILYFGASGVVRLNVIVTPLIIFGIVFAHFANNTVGVFSYNNFVSSAVVYTSYNIIAMPFVLLGLKDLLYNSKKIFLCSVVFVTTILLLAVCILKLLNGTDVNVSIPLINVVTKGYRYVLIFVLAMSMLTTAVSNGYGFLNSISVKQSTSLLFIGIFAVLFSMFSFSFIVKYLYGFFGYIGIYILLINFYIFIKNREKPRKIEKIKRKLK